MSKEVYKELLAVMKKRGGGYSGMDIPEFYELVEELFTPEEAEVNNAMPRRPFTAKVMAEEMGRDAAEIKEILEAMANKGICIAVNMDGTQFYQSTGEVLSASRIGLTFLPFRPHHGAVSAITSLLLLFATRRILNFFSAILIFNNQIDCHIHPPSE